MAACGTPSLTQKGHRTSCRPRCDCRLPVLANTENPLQKCELDRATSAGYTVGVPVGRLGRYTGHARHEETDRELSLDQSLHRWMLVHVQLGCATRLCTCLAALPAWATQQMQSNIMGTSRLKHLLSVALSSSVDFGEP